MSNKFDPDNLPPEGNYAGTRLPNYIKKAPWYFDTGEGSLDYLKMAPFAQQKASDLHEYVKHGLSRRQEIVKWRPGCCRNCGASTHTEFECTDRPRKRSARVTGEGIIEKEVVEKTDLSYDAKHDQYANYDKNRWWHDVRGHFRYADRVRSTANDNGPQRVEIIEKFGNSGFRNRLDTAEYIDAIGKAGQQAGGPMNGQEEDDLFVKPMATETDGDEGPDVTKHQYLMAWEGDENTRLKLRGIKQKKKKELSINNPKMINANAEE